MNTKIIADLSSQITEIERQLITGTHTHEERCEKLSQKAKLVEARKALTGSKPKIKIMATATAPQPQAKSFDDTFEKIFNESLADLKAAQNRQRTYQVPAVVYQEMSAEEGIVLACVMAICVGVFGIVCAVASRA